MGALKNIDRSIQTSANINHSTYLKAALAVTHKRAAELLGISPATESEWATEHMERACQFLAAVGLKVVDKNAGEVPPEQMRAFITLANAHMERVVAETRVVNTQPGELAE
jgi:DNA-binding transcriptional regulator YdaS (Cro superfamily)